MLKEKKVVAKEDLPYTYLIAWEMSDRKIGLTNEMKSDVTWEEVTQYRCFDEKGEVYGFRSNDNFVTRQIIEDAEEESIVLEYPLIGEAKSIGESLLVKHYITYDEDGQGMIIASRCFDIKKKGV